MTLVTGIMTYARNSIPSNMALLFTADFPAEGMVPRPREYEASDTLIG